jgi:RND family efflux transporter MFP subunit
VSRRRRPIALVLLAILLAAGPEAAGAPGDLDCLIQPHETVAVSSAVEGIVEKFSVDRGDLVERGAVLAVLESSMERATVALAKARSEMESAIKSSQVRVDFGVRRFVRTEEMFKKDLVPIKEMDEAETGKILAELALLEAQENRRLAELDHERAKAALELRTIRSPITGVVVERLRAVGESTGQVGQTLLFRLAQIDPLRVEVFAPVSLIGSIKIGMQGVVTPEAPLNTTSHIARVSVVDRVVDAASGTFGIRLELPNPGYRLPAGLKCKVRFR